MLVEPVVEQVAEEPADDDGGGENEGDLHEALGADQAAECAGGAFWDRGVWVGGIGVMMGFVSGLLYTSCDEKTYR